MTAEEQRDDLIAKGLSEDEASIIMKSRGDSLESAAASFDVSAIEQAAEAIAKAVGASTDLAKSEGDSDDIAKNVGYNTATIGKGYEEGSDDDEDMDDEDMDDEESAEKAHAVANTDSDYDLVAIVSKGADQILDSVENQNQALAKGYGVLAKSMGDLAKAMTDTVAAIEAKMDAVLKAIGEPVPPTTITSVEALPAPGEQVSKALTREDVIAKAQSLIKESDRSRGQQLATAVAELDSGADVSTIINRYAIH